MTSQILDRLCDSRRPFIPGSHFGRGLWTPWSSGKQGGVLSHGSAGFKLQVLILCSDQLLLECSAKMGTLWPRQQHGKNRVLLIKKEQLDLMTLQFHLLYVASSVAGEARSSENQRLSLENKVAHFPAVFGKTKAQHWRFLEICFLLTLPPLLKTWLSLSFPFSPEDIKKRENRNKRNVHTAILWINSPKQTKSSCN